MKDLKFCVVSQYWSPDITGDITRVKQVISGLKKLGCDIRVITTQPHYPAGDRKGYKFKPISASYDNGIQVWRVGMPGLPHSGFGTRFIQYSWFAAWSLLPSLVLGRGRVHWAFSQRVFSSYPAMIVRFFFRRKTVADVTDIWPEAAVNTGILRNHTGLFRVGRVAACLAYRTSSRVSTMTEPMARFLTETYGVNPARISVIPYGGIQMNLPEPGGGDFMVLYFGNLGPAYDFDVILRAAWELGSDTKFVIRGDGSLLRSLMRKKEQMGLANLEFIPNPLGDAELRSLIVRASALVLPMTVPAYPDMSFPGKLVEYIQSGRPTILLGAGYPAELVKGYDVGLVCDAGDSEGLVRAIRLLKDDLALRNRLQANAVRARDAVFGQKVVDNAVAKVVDQLG